MFTNDVEFSGKDQSRWEAFTSFLSRSAWIKPGAIALSAAVLVHLVAVHPLKQQVVELRGELDAMHHAVNRLADVGDQAWQTNDLLGALEVQADKFDAAVGTLSQLEELEHEIINLSHLAEQARMQLGPSRDTLGELTQLESELTAHAARLDEAEVAISEIETLRSTIVSQGESLATVNDIVNQQIAITESVLSSHESVAAAGEYVNGIQELADQLVAAGENSTEAQTAVNNLVAMQDALLNEQSRIAAAQQNLQSLIQLEESLAGETDRIADAVTSLELLAGFQDEFNYQVSQLSGMQESLTELILLESSVARAVRMIEPLAELTDLRRLNEDEVREAARVILDRRNTRISSLPVDTPPIVEAEESGTEILVPEPPVE